ncbi:unnamed protein product, partial [marine sediment metagenome]
VFPPPLDYRAAGQPRQPKGWLAEKKIQQTATR